MNERLSLASLPRIPSASRPGIDPAGLDVGIVHLGIGAFHRAHQAVYTEEAVAAGGGAWGICGVTERSTEVLDQLRPQDGLYSVIERDGSAPAAVRARVVGSVRATLFAREQPDELLARLAAPSTRIVSLTVTEKGYRHDPATRRLRAGDPEIAADLAGRPPQTVVGQLARGLQARRAAGSGPVTVLCCDNLPSNGATVRALVRDFCGRLTGGDGLLDWIDDNTAFPATMVDRIVPATTPADRAEAAHLLGADDHAVVVAEPFRQWVIEESFAAGRPAWEHGGAIFTRDVAPYEMVKLRLLNGAHSTIAYLGALAGDDYVAEAMARPELAELIRRLMADEVGVTVPAPDGFDLAAYRESLLERFANPALAHRTTQIAMDGSQKLPQRLLGTARDLLAAGSEPRLTALAIGAWMRYVSAEVSDWGAPLPVEDPLADKCRALVARAGSPSAAAEELLGLTEVFGVDLPGSPLFRELLIGSVEQLASDGALATIRSALH